MPSKLQIGTDGKLRLKGGKLVLDDGTHGCCCGTRTHHTPANCNDCQCPACNYVTVTAQVDGPTGGPGPLSRTVTFGPQVSGFNCQWPSNDPVFAGAQVLQCGITPNCFADYFPGFPFTTPYQGMQISIPTPSGFSCLICFVAELTDSCPDALSWVIGNNTNSSPCTGKALTSISCSDAPPP